MTGVFEREVRFNQETLFTEDSERDVKEALETVSSLHRGPAGEPGGGLILPRTLREGRRALEMESLYRSQIR